MKIKLLEKIVEHNQKLLESADGNLNDIIDDMITFKYNEYNIWDPFKDESSRFEVDPVKKYGDENINKIINEYKSLN